MTHYIRQVVAEDIAAINQIDMSYTSHEICCVRRQSHGDALTYTMHFEPLAKPFSIAYDWDWAEAPDFLAHMSAGGVLGAFASDLPAEPATSLHPYHNANCICLGLVEMSVAHTQDAVCIESLYVHRPYRNRGIGTALLNAAIAWAATQDVRALLVTTQATDVPAIRFYLRMGFAICGVHDHFYSNADLERGETAIFLAKELPAGD